MYQQPLILSSARSHHTLLGRNHGHTTQRYSVRNSKSLEASGFCLNSGGNTGAWHWREHGYLLGRQRGAPSSAAVPFFRTPRGAWADGGERSRKPFTVLFPKLRRPARTVQSIRAVGSVLQQQRNSNRPGRGRKVARRRCHSRSLPTSSRLTRAGSHIQS